MRLPFFPGILSVALLACAEPARPPLATTTDRHVVRGLHAPIDASAIHAVVHNRKGVLTTAGVGFTGA